MCGITFVFPQFARLFDGSSRVSHRGPDETSVLETTHGVFVFDRLAINDVSKGSQPFFMESSVLVCNGEIYNHRILEQIYDIRPSTGSDCEVLLWMLKYVPSIKDTFRQLNAEFACVYADEHGVIAARDPMGVRPLFIGYTEDDTVVGFSSEAKGLRDLSACHRIVQFPPGMYFYANQMRPYYALSLPLYRDLDLSIVDSKPFDKHVRTVRKILTDAVKDRVMMSERPVAFFLSGGLDSSIIASIGASLFKKEQKITTYSIGIRGSRSPDLEAARIMADYIGSEHVEIRFDPADAVQQVSRVIRQLESYDCTTVRASVPMFLLAEHVSKESQHKVILSGEGADELFGGYLYFHNAPTNEAFHDETIRLLKGIHQFDGLRADRCTAAHGLELRVPFLDPVLVEYVTTEIAPHMKNPKENNGIEKRILREAFAHMLPPEILHRQKNGMSDAVGYAWVDHLKAAFAAAAAEKHKAVTNYSVNPPMTDEERGYREIYHTFYPADSVVSHESIWRPKWSNDVTDPSARLLKSVFKE